VDSTFPGTPGRRYDIDWLRVLATYMLFPFHVAIPFSPSPFYHIRNSTVSSGLVAFLALVEPWLMPLFFVLAGWALRHSLRARGSRGFLQERFQKLVIPLVVGCLVFGPPIKYFELKSGFNANYLSTCSTTTQTHRFGPCIPAIPGVAPPPLFAEGFPEFWPTFFTRFDRFTWSHLWFLGYLFTFSVLYLPLFWWLTKSRYKAGAGVAWVYFPMIPLMLIQIVLRPHWPGIQNLYNDWANFAYFSTCLTAGFLLAKYPALEQTLRREWKRALGIGLVGIASQVPSALGIVISPTLSAVGLVVASWGIIVALLGFTQGHLMRTNALLDYLKESAYPVYLLHQAAVVCIGYRIIQLPLGIAAKYALLLMTSLAATLAAYHFLVRPIPLLRFAFGMKPVTRKTGLVKERSSVATLDAK